MIKAPMKLQDLRRRLYLKAKAEPTWRFWGLYVHVCKRETLWEAYQLAKENDGAPGIDGVTFQAIEAGGLDRFLEQLREELVQRRYRPRLLGKVGIPKEGWKVRQLSIPAPREPDSWYGLTGRNHWPDRIKRVTFRIREMRTDHQGYPQLRVGEARSNSRKEGPDQAGYWRSSIGNALLTGQIDFDLLKRSHDDYWGAV